MRWTKMLERYGIKQESSGAEIDPFALLHNAGPLDAKVSFTVGTSAEYGAVKVSATVSLSCPQLEPCVNMAGELAFRKALELCNDGGSLLELPALPRPEDA